MRNAAMMLGIIGGIGGAIVGFFGYLFAWFDENYQEVTDAARDAGIGEAMLDPTMLKVLSFAAPILAIAGAAMARSRPIVAAVLLALSCIGMFYAFGFGLFTGFPLTMCGLAVVLAVLGAVLPPKEAHD